MRYSTLLYTVVLESNLRELYLFPSFHTASIANLNSSLLAYPPSNTPQNNQILYSTSLLCNSQVIAKQAYTSPHFWATSNFAQDSPNLVTKSITWELKTILITHSWLQKIHEGVLGFTQTTF